ncbi:hypothetical protein MJG53_014474 [Ovis ammon polii x Ovis aries]|uniref:Uncharacterized protein n=3 Tax=Ovis TaxID=9935 RepID=A0A835ZXW8_SHEEP|nr:hypothetical protein JEQ12_007347 [Ovis aries]KAI4536308.1 hypothetical protein MG293_013700 [Ovis ammon polii]KAI4557408.1 hypothetical protein MJT46_014087 [Ovis ammon polii x Ovis aries]KAI4568856.1 hypothetical protein MJG53_014474 [Ovis ammon polii x Ovis aries]
MASSGLQILEIILTLLGWVNVITSCTQPLWKIIFVISAVLTLITGCWTAHTIIWNFYNALVSEAQKRELEASIYLD